MYSIPQKSIELLMSIIERSEHIAIVSHKRPDGDAVGSCNALKHFLKGCCSKNDVSVVLPNAWNDSISYILTDNDLPDTVLFSRQEALAKSKILAADTIFCLDMNAFDRSADLQGYLEESKAVKILIDHHINPDKDSFSLVFSDTEVSSTCELCYHIMMALPCTGGKASSLPAQCALSLMSGITTDTNNFEYSVFPQTMEVGAALIEAGVDRASILCHVFYEYTENRIRLMGHMLAELMQTRSNGLSYIILDAKTLSDYGVKDTELEGFVNIPLSIKEIHMSLLLRENEEGYRVSIRTKSGYSANNCASKYFHGGGHENAAGGKLLIPQDLQPGSDIGSYIEQVTKEYLEDR